MIRRRRPFAMVSSPPCGPHYRSPGKYRALKTNNRPINLIMWTICLSQSCQNVAFGDPGVLARHSTAPTRNLELAAATHQEIEPYRIARASPHSGELRWTYPGAKCISAAWRQNKLSWSLSAAGRRNCVVSSTMRRSFRPAFVQALRKRCRRRSAKTPMPRMRVLKSAS